MKAVLAAEKSLNPARFSAIGYSEYRPIADNKTDAGRQKNRRVEIFIARNYRFNPDESPGGKQGAKADAGAQTPPVNSGPATPSTNGAAGSNMATTSM